MDFGIVIERSWQLIWRYRFLWILGILAGGGLGSCSISYPITNSNVNSRDLEIWGINSPESLASINAWVNQNLGLLILVTSVIVVTGIVFWLISIIFEGSITSATTDLAMGRASRFSKAWRDGLHYFWRFFGLFWLMILIWTVVLVVLGGPAFLLLTGGSATVCFGGLWIAVAFLLFLGIMVSLSVIVPYAFRAIVVENHGPIQGIRFGYDLFRRNLGTSLLALLISILLRVAANIIIVIAWFMSLFILAIPGFLIFAVANFTVGFFIFLGFALLILWAFGLILSGIVNAYFYSYWTFVYLNLTGRVTHSLETELPPRPPYTI